MYNILYPTPLQSVWLSSHHFGTKIVLNPTYGKGSINYTNPPPQTLCTKRQQELIGILIRLTILSYLRLRYTVCSLIIHEMYVINTYHTTTTACIHYILVVNV